MALATYRVNGLHCGGLLSLELERVLPIRLNESKIKYAQIASNASNPLRLGDELPAPLHHEGT